MAQLGFAFNAQQHAPADSGALLLNGWHLSQIISSEMKPTKNGTGQYLELLFQVLEGPFKNRKTSARLNLVNANPTAVEIAYADFSSIIHAVKMEHQPVTDSAMLHNKPLKIKVITKQSEGYEPSNEVKRYAAADDASITCVTQADVDKAKAKPAMGTAPAAPTMPQAAPTAPAMPTQQPVQQAAPAQPQAVSQPWGEPETPQPTPQQEFIPPAEPVTPATQEKPNQEVAPATLPQGDTPAWAR